MQYNTVVITGGTGFVGKALCDYMLAQGKTVYVLTRNCERANLMQHDNLHYVEQLRFIPTDVVVDVAINLAGESLNAGRWNPERKKVFISSRVQTTHTLVEWMKEREEEVRPKVLVSGSAIGWYGHQESKELNEESEAALGYSHSLCKKWETKAVEAKELGVRVVLLRTGIVLEKDGGPLKAMLLPFKLGLGGKLGNGRQYWSWIHRMDLIRMIDFIIQHNDIEGPVNGTAPYPVTQKYFAATLGTALLRPALIPMPSTVASIVIGEFATETLLNGQRVFPTKISNAGFHFHYATLEKALHAIFHRHSAVGLNGEPIE